MSNGHDKANACVPGQKVGNVVQNCPPKTGAIWVYVKDSQGKGVGNVNLSAPGAATTDASGLAVFDSLAVKNYVVTLSKLPDQAAQDYYLLDADRTMRAVGVTAGSINKVVFQLKLKPSPTISVDAPKIVLVKRAYQGKDKPGVKPHRIHVRLGVDTAYDGHGELTVNHDDIKLFEKQDDKTEKALPYSVKAADLKAGKTVWLEGKAPSADVASTELKLTLKGGAIPPKKVDATEKITCIQLQLDIYAARPEGGAEPAKIDEGKKIDPGRNILVQGATDARLWAQRAKLVVARALPSTYTGNVVLKGLTGGVEAFKDTEEKPASGQKAITAANLKWANTAIDAANGQKLWVQGKAQSAKMSDTGWKVELEVLPDVEGDRVTMTVLKAEIALCKSRTDVPAKKPKPEEFNDNDKFDTGRYVHLQDTSFHHGRAMIVVKKVKPDGFVGKLELKAFDATQKPSYSAVKSGAPKVKIFKEKEEVAKSGQAALGLPLVIDHPAGYPKDGNVYWVEGATVSGALRDCELRLGVTDVDIGCDRVEFTVVQFKKIIADIPSTPEQQKRKRSNGGPDNSPVPRHTLKLADPPAAKDYDEDFTKNEPLVLIEDSVLAADRVKMSVEIDPAGVGIPIRWSAQRDRSAEGDHKDIIALKGNDDLTLDPTTGTLMLDNVGSFHVRPYIDCNGNNKYDYNTDKGERIDREPFIIMNLVIIRVQSLVNNSKANPAAFDPAKASGPGVDYVAGRPMRVSTGDFKATGNDAVTMDVTVRVIGGGKDGKTGLKKLFGSWCNNELDCPTSPGPGGHGEDVTHHFRRPAPPPPPPLSRTRCFWKLNGAEIHGPMLDSGYEPNEGIGGDTCTGTLGHNGNWPPKAQPADPSGVGERWQIVNADSPGVSPILNADPADALATLRRFTMNFDWQCALVFWTNRHEVPGPDDFPACRLYVTVQTNTWNIRLESTFDDALVETKVTPIKVTFNKDGNDKRTATAVAGSGLETRDPDGVGQLQVNKSF
jgi:hypothetical protein